jgi:hypothetical protein
VDGEFLFTSWEMVDMVGLAKDNCSGVYDALGMQISIFLVRDGLFFLVSMDCYAISIWMV